MTDEIPMDSMVIVVGEQKTVVMAITDPEYVSFVAKVQKAKTRKGKDYFIFRVTIPKKAAKDIDADSEDYLLLKAKKAKWYHMLNWNEMAETWQMLPRGVQEEVILSGLQTPVSAGSLWPTGRQLEGGLLGSGTSTVGSSLEPFAAPLQISAR